MLRFARSPVLHLVGLLVIAGLLVWLCQIYPVLDWIIALQEWMAQQGVTGVLLYPMFYAICNVLLLPAGILSVGGGFFFGLWWGFLLVLVGNLLGAALAFMLTRKLARKWIGKKLLARRKWFELDLAIEREGWKIVLLSQLNPLFPTSLLNYLSGLTSMRFRQCMLWIALGQAPGLFLYAYFGTLGQLGVNLLRGESDPATHEYFIWFGGLVLSAAVTVMLGRVAFRLLREAEERASSVESSLKPAPVEDLSR